MEWSFTDEQNELRRTVKRFVDEELRPVADRIDKEHKIPESIIRMMAELGFLGVVFPEEYDGAVPAGEPPGIPLFIGLLRAAG